MVEPGEDTNCIVALVKTPLLFRSSQDETRIITQHSYGIRIDLWLLMVTIQWKKWEKDNTNKPHGTR